MLGTAWRNLTIISWEQVTFKLFSVSYTVQSRYCNVHILECSCVGIGPFEKYFIICSIDYYNNINILSFFAGMNPAVDTSFVPDRHRDEEENKLR